MSASTGDKITDTRNAARPNSTTVATGRVAGATSLICQNLVGWPTASKVHFVTYQIDSLSEVIAGTQLDCSGIVSGNTITSFSVIDGTDNGNSIGDIVEMLPTAAWGQDLADALGAGHDRTGAHKASLLLTTPILTTPAIADFTSANHTHASTAQGGQLTASAFANNAITAPLLATSAIKLGVTTDTSSPLLTSGGGNVTVCTAVVTIPAGGRDVEIIGFIPSVGCGGVATGTATIFDGATQLNSISEKWVDNTYTKPLMVYAYLSAPAAGSKTITLKAAGTGGANLQVSNTANSPSILTVKLM